MEGVELRMAKIMLINVTHAEESRVGIVEDGQLESFEIESFSREHLKGNIYKGMVRRIHPAIEAAFVDIGAERDAFLPLDEICFRNLPPSRNGASGDKGRRRIKDVLKSGDEILVQIIKEQFTNKPPTLSTFYSLPGRYLVLLPGSEDAGISRRIEGEERVRIREMLSHLHPPDDCGIIVRTAAGFDEEQGELERDLAYLTRLWDSIVKHAETRRAPALIYREHDLVLRNIRDYFTPDIGQIFIDNEEVYERARDFLHNVMPGKEHLLHLYQGARPIFSHFGLEAQIESIYKRRVQLKSGGSIVIDGTEALTAIDVNSGGSMRGANQEDTAYKTNLEAANEIARQLRLRDLGGIIVVDFIDMREQKHINEVEHAMRHVMRADKARHDMGRISRLGLLEISRQRLRPTAASSSYAACPMCEGHGSVRTTESAALVVLRKLHHRVAEGDVAQMKVGLPRDVAMYLLNQKRDDLAILETRYAARIQVVINDKLMPHESEIETRTRETPLVEAMPRPTVGAAGTAVTTPPQELRRPSGLVMDTAPAVEAPEARAKRRRRRGGRGRRPGEAVPVASGLRAEQEAGADSDLAPPPATGGVPAVVAPVAPAAADVPHGEETSGMPPSGAPIVVEMPAERPEEPSLPVTADEERAGPPGDEASEEIPAAVQEIPEEAPGIVADVAEGPGLTTDSAGGFVRPEGLVEAPPGEDVVVGTATPVRRRRRRGGRRGGRGGRGGGVGSPEPGVSGEPGAEGSSPESTSEEGGQAATHRRRRRGGARRRRPQESEMPPSGPPEPPLGS